MPFEALFLTDELRAAVSDDAWVAAFVDVERALLRVQHGVELPAATIDAAELLRDARRDGNPVIPLVALLREAEPRVHDGATSQDVLDTACALVARRAGELVRRELDAVAALCAALAERHRDDAMSARTLLQQATPTTFGLVAAGWLNAVLSVRELPALPAQLGGPSGTAGTELRRRFADELGLDEPVLSTHADRVAVGRVGAALALAAGACAKIALDLQLLSQTEVGEVREARPGGSSSMPHKQNPVASTLARACATTAVSAAEVLVRGVGAHEHGRAGGAWHAEWRALSDAFAFAGSAAAWARTALDGLEVDAGRMRANMTQTGPAGAAGELVDRALAAYRR